MNLNYEAKYVFEYEGYSYIEHHYTDDVEGRRYKVSDGSSLEFLKVTNIAGTNDEFKIIRPKFLGSLVLMEDENLKRVLAVFELTDVEKIAILLIEIDKTSNRSFWGYQNNAGFHDKITGGSTI